MLEPRNDSEEYWVCYSQVNIGYLRFASGDVEISLIDLRALPKETTDILSEWHNFMEHRGYQKYVVRTQNFDVLIKGLGHDTSSEELYDNLDFEEEKTFWQSKLKQIQDKNTTLPASQEDLSKAVASLLASQKYLYEALIFRAQLNTGPRSFSVRPNNSSFKLLTSQLTRNAGRDGINTAIREWLQDQLNYNTFEETVQELAIAYNEILGLVLADFINAMSIQHSVTNAAKRARKGTGYLSLELTKRLDSYLLEGFTYAQIDTLFSKYHQPKNSDGRSIKVDESTLKSWIADRQKVRKFNRRKSGTLSNQERDVLQKKYDAVVLAFEEQPA